MASNIINVTEKAEVNGGPKIEEVVEYTCDSYEVIEVVIPGPTTAQQVVLQGVGSEMSLLQISVPNGVYGTTPYVSYHLNAAINLEVPLNNMQQFIGRGAILAAMEAGGSAEITDIFLNNVHTEDITVQILVGKDVTIAP